MSDLTGNPEYVSVPRKALEDVTAKIQKLQGSEEIIHRLEKDLATARAERDSLKTTIEKSEQASAKLTGELAKLQSQISFLEVQLREAQQAGPVSGEGGPQVPVIRVQVVPDTPQIDPTYVNTPLDRDIELQLQDQVIVGLVGPAGAGKTKRVEQTAARLGRPFFLINSKGDLAHDLLESVALLPEGGSCYRTGVLLEALRIPDAVVLIDEIDTMDPGFQGRLLSLMEEEPHRRRVTTNGLGVVHANPTVSICWTANNLGNDPDSRHVNNYLLPAHHSRASVLEVPLPDQQLMCDIIAATSGKPKKDCKRYAQVFVSLMKACSDGKLDLDVSPRIAVKTVKQVDRYLAAGFNDTDAHAAAFRLEVTNKLPLSGGMRQAAADLINTQFKVEV